MLLIDVFLIFVLDYLLPLNNTTSFFDKLPVTVYNTLGQTLAYYTVSNSGAGYIKTIDVSYVAKDVYSVKVGAEGLNKIRRIIVK